MSYRVTLARLTYCTYPWTLGNPCHKAITPQHYPGWAAASVSNSRI